MMSLPFVSKFHVFLLVVLAVLVVVGIVVVPLDQSLPIHWGLSGQADGFAPALVALLLPPVIVLAVLGVLAAMRRARLQRDFEAGRHVIDASIGVVTSLALCLEGATIMIGLGMAVDMPRLIAFVLGLMLVVVGNVLPKSQPNWVAGIRLPWTLRDPENWRVTHRWTGRLMMLAGAIVIGLASIGLPPKAMIAVVIAAALLPAVVGIVISYVLAVRK